MPYRGIASAITPITHRPSQSSVFIVAKSNPATHWTDLRGKRLGYINAYCTTSYFSPSILLAREGFSLREFFNAFPVAAWQGQIDAVVTGSIDATMVYEDVWLACPDNAERTKILARLDDLPTPPRQPLPRRKTANRRGPCAPMTILPPMSPVREAPVTRLSVRGIGPLVSAFTSANASS